MNNKLLQASDVIDHYDLFLVDIWGVFLEELAPYPNVADTLNWIGERKTLCFLSNTPRLRPAVQKRLSEAGVSITENRIYTAGETAAKILSESQKYLSIADPKIYYLSDPKFADSYSDINLNTVDRLEDANILLVTAMIEEGEDLTKYDEMLEYAASLGITCLCSNPDTIIPANGKLRYCPGYIVKNYKGKLIYSGKPYKDIFEMALDDYPHISKDRILMIGDTIETDILGAKNVGIHSALVHTGNAAKIFNETNGNIEAIRSKLAHAPSIFLTLSS
jgi:HAD superfamily hydrolase (TIGR01459 family)